MYIPLGCDFQGPAAETRYMEEDLLWAAGSSQPSLDIATAICAGLSSEKCVVAEMTGT